METINVVVEGYETFEFVRGDGTTVGAIERRIRESCRLAGGSVRLDRRAFLDSDTLPGGDYSFNGFTKEGN